MWCPTAQTKSLWDKWEIYNQKWYNTNLRLTTVEGEMNYINELPILIAERVKISLGPEELLKIDNDKHLRFIVLDAAGHVAGVLLDRIRNDNKFYFNLNETATLSDVMRDVSKNIFEKAIDDSTISQAITVLKEEQKSLRQQVENRKI